MYFYYSINADIMQTYKTNNKQNKQQTTNKIANIQKAKELVEKFTGSFFV